MNRKERYDRFIAQVAAEVTEYASKYKCSDDQALDDWTGNGPDGTFGLLRADRKDVEAVLNQAAYRWKITKDWIDDGTNSREGTEGPRNLNDSISDNAAEFKLYDDDGNLYYEGIIYGDYEGFEPMDDFGTPNAGCTMMKLDGEWL